MSATKPIDSNRRLWLATTSVVSGAGLAASAVPFVVSLTPSEKARALADRMSPNTTETNCVR